jgi:hypothetical protein
VLPWLPWRQLTDADLGALRRGETLTVKEVKSADWAFPPGFPEPPPLTRAFHRGALVALLEGGRVHTLLPGGV